MSKTTTATETLEEQVVRLEREIAELTQANKELTDKADGHEYPGCDRDHISDDVEKAMELFADPNNWLERIEDGKFVWSPVMNYIERDPSFLASQALKNY